MLRIVFAFFMVLAISPVASAKLFRCTDDDGVVAFSDTPCASGAEEVKGLVSAKSGKGKDDIAIQNCVDYLIGDGRISDPEGIKVQSHYYEWVTVKDIGARRMLHVMINVRNKYGAYSGAESMQCLLLGDGLTVNSNNYELVQ